MSIFGFSGVHHLIPTGIYSRISLGFFAWILTRDFFRDHELRFPGGCSNSFSQDLSRSFPCLLQSFFSTDPIGISVRLHYVISVEILIVFFLKTAII